MVIARFWAATDITSVTSKLGTSTPPIRFMNGCLVVGMRENCVHEIVEHLGIGRHRPARVGVHVPGAQLVQRHRGRKSTRLNSSHSRISYAVFCLKKKNKKQYN